MSARWFAGETARDSKLACGCYADWDGSRWVVTAAYFLCFHRQGDFVNDPPPKDVTP